MKILACLLCDRATIREGLLHILGGGATLLGRPNLPAALDVDLALLLQPDDPEEVLGDHRIGITVAPEGGSTVAQVEFALMAASLDPFPDPMPNLPISVPLRNVAVSAYGRYIARVVYDQTVLNELRFSVDKQTSPGVTQAADSTGP
ncbi:hypothetical protein AB0L00_05015 [Actinoallomurus sp. NPDC052308]|uniref:DUF6941 family protein n=1 Tax=Actinoallomurus sp. NPDC052308 TaxID=3155530 RepID=UPI0034294592